MSDSRSPGSDPSGLGDAERHKLESLAAMAMGIAHELNNHLSAIEGNNKLLLRLMEDGSEFIPYLERIKDAADQALDLTGELGVYAGRLEPDRKPVSIGAMLNDLHAQWKDSSNRVTIDVADDCPDIRVDENLLRGAVSRLMANADEATLEMEGSITVSVRTGSLTEEDSATAYGEDPPGEGTYLTISVSDSGSGISTAVKRRMFDPFFSTKIRGQGMGLPFVIGVARAHNGAVSFNTGSNGTTVRLHLPISTSD